MIQSNIDYSLNEAEKPKIVRDFDVSIERLIEQFGSIIIIPDAKKDRALRNDLLQNVLTKILHLEKMPIKKKS